MEFLEKVFSRLGESEQRTLREILVDEPPVSIEEAEGLLDNLRIQKVQRELAAVQECIQDAGFQTHLPALVTYQRGLRRLLEPHMVTCRQIFCRWKAETGREVNDGATERP